MRPSLNTITRLSLTAFTYIAYIGMSAAQTTTSASSQPLSPEELRLRHDWRVSMAQVPAPRKGCFQSDYPSMEWREVACVRVPFHPMVPKKRPRALVGGGNANSISAMAPTGSISTAIGSFQSVTNVTSVSSVFPGKTDENGYSLQINTNFFNGPICNGSTDPSSQCAWEQFLYINTPTTGFGYIEYWLFKPNGPCPAGWGTYDGDCVRDSAMGVQMPSQPITNLEQLGLTGGVSATGDYVQVLVGDKIMMAKGDNLVDAAVGWQIAEFNVFGEIDGAQAVFNNGAQVVPRTEIIYGGIAAPICVAQGFTGETNNLSFGPSAPQPSPPGPAILFTESTPTDPKSSNCAYATAVGDAHLNTFLGLLYDFQASGDFVLTQVDPDFVVQARQVSGAPRWPNAAVNEAIATQMGQTKVAVCPARLIENQSPLIVNGANIALTDGSVFSTPDGVDIWRFGSVYTITDQSGNSVQAVLNPTWLDVSVGLGQWPATITGLLANANGNVNQIATRALATSGPTVLTAPFDFGAFYQSYGQSWRVAPGESLLSACGQPSETGNPQIPFYATDLDPQLYNSSRAVCTAAGVTGAALLDACTLDVAVIGTNAAANVYVNARQPVAVGSIGTASTSTTLTYTGDTTGDYHDTANLSATLVLQGTSIPVTGQLITLTLGAQNCSGTTNTSGIASCSLTLNQVPGPYTVAASFAGSGNYLASSAPGKAFTITKEETTTKYTGATLISNGVLTTFSVVLLEDGVTPISGRTIQITLGTGSTAQTCTTGTTNASGSASCTIPEPAFRNHHCGQFPRRRLLPAVVH